MDFFVNSVDEDELIALLVGKLVEEGYFIDDEEDRSATDTMKEVLQLYKDENFGFIIPDDLEDIYRDFDAVKSGYSSYDQLLDEIMEDMGGYPED